MVNSYSFMIIVVFVVYPCPYFYEQNTIIINGYSLSIPNEHEIIYVTLDTEIKIKTNF